MTTFIARRVLLSLPVLFGMLFATFALGRLIPGDPCHAILGEKATEVVCDEFITAMAWTSPSPRSSGYT